MEPSRVLELCIWGTGLYLVPLSPLFLEPLSTFEIFSFLSRDLSSWAELGQVLQGGKKDWTPCDIYGTYTHTHVCVCVPWPSFVKYQGMDSLCSSGLCNVEQADVSSPWHLREALLVMYKCQLIFLGHTGILAWHTHTQPGSRCGLFYLTQTGSALACRAVLLAESGACGHRLGVFICQVASSARGQCQLVERQTLGCLWKQCQCSCRRALFFQNLPGFTMAEEACSGGHWTWQNMSVSLHFRDFWHV